MMPDDVVGYDLGANVKKVFQYLHKTTTVAVTRMSDFLSVAWRSFRYCTAIIGGIASAALIAIGAIIHTRDADHGGVEDEMILAAGSLFALLSCMVGCQNVTSDRQVKRLIEASEAQTHRLAEANATLEGQVNQLKGVEQRLGAATTDFETKLRVASERYKKRLEELQQTSQALSATVTQIGDERNRLAAENAELLRTREQFGKTLNDYKIELAKVREAHAAATTALAQLRTLAGDESARIQQLEAINVEQQRRLDEASKQLENLNELQRKSVRMIQLLTLYGDECKTLGVSLKDISGSLHQTDKTLGLTAGEMSLQLRALQTITDELKKVASAGGTREWIDEDHDDTEDYESLSSREDDTGAPSSIQSV
jgi:DNA repair exonuclease SbcCD ATPase subunit